MAFTITYVIDSDAHLELIESIRVEQTIEFPYRLAPSWIQEEIVGKVISIESQSSDKVKVKITYHEGIAGGELTQFLNLLFGNVSLFPRVLIQEIELPSSFTNTFKGPRFGISGMRKLLGITKRPFLMTALKPMGLNAGQLAEMAATLARGGIDIIKDDHSLANQPWATWRERVEIVSKAVNEANQKYGRNALYAPSLNRPTEQFFESARYAKQKGCGALLVLPGICGYDAMRAIADDDSIALPVLSHPALLGTFVMNTHHGFSPGITFGTLVRLAGGDMTIFPSNGGRFSFTLEQCNSVLKAAQEPLGNLATSSATLAGGMTIERVPDLVRDFGSDITILIGGALQDGNPLENALRLREAVESYA
jgi:ribulose-bisphosphate carboxylase large chain